MKADRSTFTIARAQYFLYFMAFGCWAPFINLYYERLGLSGIEIGSLIALSVLVTTGASFLWGALADARRLHRQLLWAGLFLSPLAAWLLGLAPGFAALIPCVAALALVSSPVQSLIDSFALEVVNTGRRTFGEMRLWGAIGWAAATWGMGALIESSNIRLIFYGYALGMGATLLLSFLQPARRVVLRAAFGAQARRLVRRDLVVFFLSVFLVTITTGGVESFFSIYLDRLGAGETLIGLGWTMAALAEIPVMLYSGALIRRLGAGNLIKIAFGLYALCWLGYSLIDNPLWALPLQVLNGFAFGGFLTGGVTYLNRRTPKGLNTTAQSIFNAICFGLAWMVGSLLGGYLFDQVGLVALFRVLSGLALVGLAVFVLGSRNSPEVELEPAAAN